MTKTSPEKPDLSANLFEQYQHFYAVHEKLMLLFGSAMSIKIADSRVSASLETSMLGMSLSLDIFHQNNNYKITTSQNTSHVVVLFEKNGVLFPALEFSQEEKSSRCFDEDRSDETAQVFGEIIQILETLSKTSAAEVTHLQNTFHKDVNGLLH